jgi:hypothetical protein
LVRHRTTLKNRIHATLITFGHPCPVSDLFGLTGRELLDRLEIPDPWRRNVDVSLGLIDDLELQFATLTVQLERTGADHRYIQRLIDRCRPACHQKAVGSSPISRFRDVRLPSGFCVPPALSTDQAVGPLVRPDCVCSCIRH